MKYPIPPGVFDIIPNDPREPWKSSHLWAYVEKIIRQVAHEFGYCEIRTPIFERTELFRRGVGETSDIVSKEMYTFEDRGGRSMSLRPEGTAPVMRSFVENQFHQEAPVHKLFYIGPMFRYERSQAGRYRQHHQFGAEAIGHGSPEQDAELIDMLYTLYQRLGLKNLSLYINSIGDTGCRQAFRTALQDYLRPLLHLLSPESQNRFEANPLRILDSKDPRDQEIVAKAPNILDYLSAESREHFEKLQVRLQQLNIPFQVNPRLVRGLDYYNRTVFEVVAGELGAQNSMGGGGRYDGLLSQLGGPDLSAIGFGTGIERIIHTMIGQEVALPSPDHPTLFLIPIGDEAKNHCFSLLHNLRANRIPSQMDFSDRKLGKVMQYADQIMAQYVVVVGDQELQEGYVELKEMATGEKTLVALTDLIAILKIDAASAHFIDTCAELSRPFKSKGESDFFLKKIKSSLAQTQELATSIHQTLETLKVLVEDGNN